MKKVLVGKSAVQILVRMKCGVKKSVYFIGLPVPAWESWSMMLYSQPSAAVGFMAFSASSVCFVSS
jgi:hypothetical protein